MANKVTKEELMGCFKEINDRYLEMADILSSFYDVLPEEVNEMCDDKDILDDFNAKLKTYLYEGNNNE